MTEHGEAKRRAEIASGQASPGPASAAASSILKTELPQDHASGAGASAPNDGSEDEENKFVRMIETMTASLRSLADGAEPPSSGARRAGVNGAAPWPDLSVLLEPAAARDRKDAVDGAVESPRSASADGGVDARGEPAAPADSASSVSDKVAPFAAIAASKPVGSEKPLGPADDPDNLFASAVPAPGAVPVRPAAPAVAPLDLDDVGRDEPVAAEPPVTEIPEAAGAIAKAAAKETDNHISKQVAGDSGVTAKADAAASAEAQPPVPSPAASPSAPMARAPANDPLAPLQELSEEEIIALFS